MFQRQSCICGLQEFTGSRPMLEAQYPVTGQIDPDDLDLFRKQAGIVG